MKKQRSFLNSFIRKLILLALIAGGVFLAKEAFLYTQVRDQLPAGTTIAGIEVSGLLLAQAGEKVSATFFSPIYVTYRDEQIEVDPATVGFQLNLEGMLRAAREETQAKTVWEGYFGYLIGRALKAVEIPLAANHEPMLLQSNLEIIAEVLDKAVQLPELDPESGKVIAGTVGYNADISASLEDVTKALYRPENRKADLIIVEEKPENAGIELLQNAINKKLLQFSGIGSVFVLNLQTGDEVNINSDMALSGTSMMKIFIMTEALRNYYDGQPAATEWEYFVGTATLSSDYFANLLLRRVAARPNEKSGYDGADILTESVQRLGLDNTFLVTPYQEPARANKTTFITEANSQPDAIKDLDDAMQTTTEDIGSYLAMLHYCSQGKGGLLAAYPGQLTSEECQLLIDIMAQNFEGNLIRIGVPEGVKVSHKHGWINNTHGDAGIVYSANGPYVIIISLYQPGDWLEYTYSFPVIREISQLTYNYFNPDAPYLEDPANRVPEIAEVEN